LSVVLLTWCRFHCLFCHGYEERGGHSAGVFAIDDCAPAGLAVHLARFALRLADNVTIYTNGDEKVAEEIRDVLSKAGPETRSKNNITIEGKKIAKLVKGPKGAEIEVVLADGSKKTEAFVAHKPKGVVNGPFVEQLGLETTPQGDIKVNAPFNETSVPGVFAAGDCGTPMKAVTVAISAGGFVGAGVAASLAAED
jgi:thioredoxin reductase